MSNLKYLNQHLLCAEHDYKQPAPVSEMVLDRKKHQTEGSGESSSAGKRITKGLLCT